MTQALNEIIQETPFGHRRWLPLKSHEGVVAARGRCTPLDLKGAWCWANNKKLARAQTFDNVMVPRTPYKRHKALFALSSSAVSLSAVSKWWHHFEY